MEQGSAFRSKIARTAFRWFNESMGEPVCARAGCGNTVDKTNGKYCGRKCAPFAHLENAPRKTRASLYNRELGASTSQAPGGLSVELNKDKLKKDREAYKEKIGTPKSWSYDERSGVNRTQSDETKSVQSESSLSNSNPESKSAAILVDDPFTDERTSSTIDWSKDLGIKKTESAILSTRFNEETNEIQLVKSESSSESLNKANLASMNLIDDSVDHLHGLMKSVAKPSDEMLNTQRVQAAANCAHQIQSLIRLKLDIVKEMRKNGNSH